jgi:beta-lactam-binding protein with PASTA domain
VAAGLTLGVVSVSDSPAGGQRVLSVGGGEGSAVPPGTPIDLVVASGSNFVPRVVGLTVSSAIEAIRGAGFTAVRHNQADSDHASDTVLGSSPGETALLPVGAEVVIDVSVAPVVVPTGTPSPTPSSSPSPSATPTIP